jgi:hypothetical protein
LWLRVQQSVTCGSTRGNLRQWRLRLVAFLGEAFWLVAIIGRRRHRAILVACQAINGKGCIYFDHCLPTCKATQKNRNAETIESVVSMLTSLVVQRGRSLYQYGTLNFDVTSHCTRGPFKDHDHGFAQCPAKTVLYSDGQLPYPVNIDDATPA